MPGTILIFLFGDLGDALLTVPAMRALRIAHPAARLVVAAKGPAGNVARDLGLVDEVIAIDKHLFDRPLSLLRPPTALALVRVLLRLRRERADAVILFHHLLSTWGTVKFALLALATGAPERVGLNNGRGWFLTRSVRDRGLGASHEAEYWMEVAALLGARGPLELEAPIAERDRQAVGHLLREVDADSHGRPLLAVHPGTGWYGPGRRWPAARFAAAASLVMRCVPLHCVIVGTEQEAEEAAEVARLLGSQATNLIGRTSVGELGALLERCTLLIANDGGVAHLGAAAGCPVVAVFGPSNDRAWRPLGGTVVAADLGCRPCFYRDFETGTPAGCATRECLAMVTPAMVADAALATIRTDLAGESGPRSLELRPAPPPRRDRLAG